MTRRPWKLTLWVLAIVCAILAVRLIRMHEHAEPRTEATNFRKVSNASGQPIRSATLMMANDVDGSLTPVTHELTLPADAAERAKALLNDLFAEYALPGSKHPLANLPAVRDVFLLPLPGSQAARARGLQPSGSSPADAKVNRLQLAVVNLNGAFVARHPSGVLVETLTLVSILGTLRTNLPQIAQVRFLVDGKRKATLAGHVDLTGTYLTSNDVPETTTTAMDTSSPSRKPETPGKSQ
jgi:hypothetical protein